MTTEAILIHLSPILFYGLLTGFLLLEAASDREAIRTNGTIDHTMNWIARAIAALVMASPYLIYAKSFWFALAMLCSAAFGFSALFRWRLNKLRGKHPCYVSPSSWYDFGYMVILGEHRPHRRWTWSNWKACVLNSHWINYELSPSYTKSIHRAGRLAYIVEVVLFTLGAAYTFINIPTP